MRLVEHRGKWAVRIEGKRFSAGFDATDDNYQSAERKARVCESQRIRTLVNIRCKDIVEAYLANISFALNSPAAAPR